MTICPSDPSPDEDRGISAAVYLIAAGFAAALVVAPSLWRWVAAAIPPLAADADGWRYLVAAVILWAAHVVNRWGRDRARAWYEVGRRRAWEEVMAACRPPGADDRHQ